MPWAHWSCSAARLLVVAGLALAGCRPEAQQPSVPGVPRPITGTPSNSTGEALYKSEDYAAAAWVFEQLVAGAADGDREQAQFWLGKSYFQLEDFERATRVFLSIVAAPEHEHRTMAFPWLLALRRERPGDVVLLRTIGEHGEALLEDEMFAAIRDQVLIAVGEDRLRTGHTVEALALLQQVPEAYASYGEAQLLAGLAAERLGRQAEAIERLSVAATRGAPTRREQREGQVDAYEERVRRRAARELERLGQPRSRR
jgi:tetratricopeptide (TPR) repeat protein